MVLGLRNRLRYVKNWIETSGMHILHGLLLDELAGSFVHLTQLASLQAAAGHDVSVMLRRSLTKKAKDYLPAEVSIIPAPIGAAKFLIPGIIRRIRPTIIHAHMGRFGRIAARMRDRPPAVATLHISYKKKDYSALDGLIRIANWQSRDMAGYAGRAITLWNPVRAVPAPTAEERTALRARLGMCEHDLLFGFVGRLHPMKAPELLVQAFRTADVPRSRLAIVGDGPLRSEVASLAKEDNRIILLGEQDALRWYQAFDIFVLSSRSEPYGLVILEAMQAQLPIVATRVAGPLEILAGAPVHWAAPDHVASLSTALNLAAVARRGNPAPIRYDLTPFSAEVYLNRIMHFYEEILSAYSSVRNHP